MALLALTVWAAVAVAVAMPGRAWAQAAEGSAPRSLSDDLDDLLSTDPHVQQAALEAIVAYGEPGVAQLEGLAADGHAHPRQRAGAIYALGRIGAASSRPVLEGLWAAGVDALGGAIAMQVAASLAEYGDLDPLRQLLDSGAPVLVAKAAVQLGLRQDAQSLPAIQGAYGLDTNARIQPYLAIALGLLGDGQGEATLRSGLLTEELRDHCAVALSRLGMAGDARFELEFALDDPDPLVRLGALEGLIGLAPHNLDELLARAAADPDGRVSQRAAQAQAERARHPQRR
jgi:hypothetical protein